MRMLFIMAWRNIWRNPRRTWITLSIIGVALALAIFMRSQQLGSYETMLSNTVGTFTGHIQIHQKGYWGEQNLDNTFEYSESLIQKLDTLDFVQGLVPRLESYALLSEGNKSRAGLVIGIDPQRELELANPDKYLVKGSYFESIDSQSTLIGNDLASFLSLEVGDTLVILGQGYQGMTAAGKYLVQGLVKLPSPQLNKSVVFLPLQTSQELFAAENRLSSLIFKLSQTRKTIEVHQDVSEIIDLDIYELMTWQDLLPELVQMIQSDDVGGQIIIGILYMVVGFGIFGTILMMVMERQYEFGVLLGIGMSRFQLSLVLMIEILILSVIGLSLGLLFMIPIIAYFYYNPIILSGAMAQAIEELGFEALIAYSADPGIFWSQALIVLSMIILISIYPVWKIYRLQVVQAMRQ